MSIYLGNHGRITLRRTSNGRNLATTIDPAEVVPAKKRLAFDFETQGDVADLITGDKVEIRSSSNLVFIDSYTQNSWTGWIHRDELGGIRLYTSFINSINGGSTNAVALAAITNDISITITVQNTIHRILGQISSYELNTNADVIDVTALGDKFREQISSLLSGSGRIETAWDYRDSIGAGAYEASHYLNQLLLRTGIGSEFEAHLFLKVSGYSPSGDAGTSDDVVYYQVNGVLTATAFQFQPSEVVSMTADFVTTGEIKLVMMTVSDYKLLQENSGELRLEQDDTASLLLDQTE